MRRLPAFLHLPEWQPPFLPTRPPWERKTRYWPHFRFLRQVRCNESQVISILDFEPAYPGLSPPQSTAGQVGKPLSESGQWTATLTVRHPAKSRTLPALPLLFYIQHKGQLNYPTPFCCSTALEQRNSLHFPLSRDHPYCSTADSWPFHPNGLCFPQFLFPCFIQLCNDLLGFLCEHTKSCFTILPKVLHIIHNWSLCSV